MKKVALITGTSTGIGLETSILLAQEGYEVYATMRNLDKSDNLETLAEEKNVKLNILQLDVTDNTSIIKCVNTIISTHGRIDLLVNNAGGAMSKTTEFASESEVNWVMDLNFYGVVRCVKAVLPHMREQKSGHIINISSVGGLVGQPFHEFYCAAKFAVEGYTESMSTYITKEFGIDFSLIEPGGVKTEFHNSSDSNTRVDEKMTHPAYEKLMDTYAQRGSLNVETSKLQVFQSALDVANVIIEVVNAENPPIRIRTSEWSEEFTKIKTAADPDGTKLTEEISSIFIG